MRLALATVLVALFVGCAPRALPANPALWEVSGVNGARGYLFGTVHALAAPAAWRTTRVEAALTASDRVMVEVAGLADQSAIAATFDRLGHTPGEPPLSERIAPRLRARLDAALARAHMRDADFASTETWAAALILARALAPDANGVNGIDRAVIAAAPPRPVVELEGAATQLAIFDRLPEPDQRALLGAVVADAGALADDDDALAEAWRKGDMAPIEAATRTGLLADAGLRAALFTRRNQAWTARIGAMLARGQHPFVAVGAAHMAGDQGLPALLAARGYTVRRIE